VFLRLTDLSISGKHVVFGRVVKGYAEIVQKIMSVSTDERDRPSVPVVISHCGELELRKPPQPVKAPKAQGTSCV